MLSQLFVRFIVVTLDGRFFDRSIHSLDLSVCPRVINFRQPVFDSVLTADAVEQVHKRPLVFCAVGNLNAVIGQNRMNV